MPLEFYYIENNEIIKILLYINLIAIKILLWPTKVAWKWPESKHVKQHTGTVLKENHCQRALQIS